MMIIFHENILFWWDHKWCVEHFLEIIKCQNWFTITETKIFHWKIDTFLKNIDKKHGDWSCEMPWEREKIDNFDSDNIVCREFVSKSMKYGILWMVNVVLTFCWIMYYFLHYVTEIQSLALFNALSVAPQQCNNRVYKKL